MYNSQHTQIEMASFMSRNSLLILVFANVLTACATLQSERATSVSPDPVIGHLEKTTSGIERMLAEMNALERSRQAQPGQWKTAAEVLPPDHPMMKRLTVNLQGDVRLVIRHLADQQGMSVLVRGKAPTSIHVAVSALNKPFVAILESIGAQTGNTVNITCDTAKNLLMLEYK